MINIKFLIPVIREMLGKIINEAMSGRLQFNLGTDGIFVYYHTSNVDKPIRIEIPFPNYQLESHT